MTHKLKVRRFTIFSKTILTFWMLLFCLYGGLSLAQVPTEQLKNINASGFLLLDSTGRVLDSYKSTTPYIPASTTKLATAWLALRHWGESHRFKTAIYIDPVEKTLWIKGGGDPFLVSEELQLLVEQLKPSITTSIDTIALDVSLFEPSLVVPGGSNTDNPYDAIPTAIACNFNTIHLTRKNGVLESAEPQTPLTPYAQTFADLITGSSLRINTGFDPRRSEQYFAEVLREMLLRQGVKVGKNIRWGAAPKRAPDLIFENTHTLGAVIQLMLKYSTNFIANTLILTLVADHHSKPASFALVRDYMNSTMSQHFGWDNFNFEEGAGLSPTNLVSSEQLSDLLLAMRPWQHLLPEVSSNIFAKTGTLENVQTLAGYIRDGTDDRPFVIMINEATTTTLAKDVALEFQTRSATQ